MTDAIATFEARIAPELAQFVRPITDATRHPDNIRKHRLDKIAQSLRSHGQRAAIVVQASTGLIVKGNGTHEAAEMLGWTTLAQIWQEMTDDEALGFLYADNKASDFSSYDRDKTVAGLKKLAAGPGLFDTLWDIEELEDLIEQQEGTTVLAPQGAGEGSTVAALPAGKAGGPVPGISEPPERMKEIPVTLTLKDHAEFVGYLRDLAKQYGTSGTIATIVEAVRRQHAAEGGAAVTGSGDTEQAAYEAKRALIQEFNAYLTQFGQERSFTPVWISAQLESMVPFRPMKPAEAPIPGQVEAFPADLEETAAPVAVVSPLRQPEPTPAVPAGDPNESDDDAEALAQLARYRAQAQQVVHDAGLIEATIRDGEVAVVEDAVDPSTEL